MLKNKVTRLFCVDYRPQNNIAKKIRYLLSKINYNLNTLTGIKIFIALDLKAVTGKSSWLFMTRKKWVFVEFEQCQSKTSNIV